MSGILLNTCVAGLCPVRLPPEPMRGRLPYRTGRLTNWLVGGSLWVVFGVFGWKEALPQYLSHSRARTCDPDFNLNWTIWPMRSVADPAESERRSARPCCLDWRTCRCFADRYPRLVVRDRFRPLWHTRVVPDRSETPPCRPRRAACSQPVQRVESLLTQERQRPACHRALLPQTRKDALKPSTDQQGARQIVNAVVASDVASASVCKSRNSSGVMRCF